MRLAEFILQEMEPILAQWQEFAATRLPAARSMSELALRDHAREILVAVARDLETFQSREQQAEKSKGRAPVLLDAPETAAQTHAVLRAQSGFDINQVASEYRALRASVLRLWMDAHAAESTRVEDIVRFNEAIDQALTESIQFYNARVNADRDLFLGMLGHDMRSPLQAILTTASYLSALNAGEPVDGAAQRLMRSGSRMKGLLDDLVDFNRTKLGLGIGIERTDVDLGLLFEEELEELRAAHPGGRIELERSGDLRGRWDGSRLRQLLGNLVGNAIRYGARGGPVRVRLEGGSAEVRFEVRNSGPAIEPSVLDRIFDPLYRGGQPELSEADTSSLGLGLYIAREIAVAHGGRIEARSGEGETLFRVHLPRA
jgi:signal transduction histidine kinase